MSDVRYAIRSLMRAKGFTLAAVLTLVLGIGVNLAVFSVVDRALFRPLPFAHMDRLAFVTPYSFESEARYGGFPKRLFVEARHGVAAIEDMAYAGVTYGFRIGDDPNAPASLELTEASYNLLDVLGATPVVGRGFDRDDVEAARAVAMVTHEVWQARFGGVPTVVGTELRFRDKPTTIIGVLPPGFIAPAMGRGARFDGLHLLPDLMESAGPRGIVWPGTARLAPGVSIAVAQQQLDALAARLDPELRPPGQPTGPRVLVESLRAGMFWNVHRYLWLVTLAASLVGLLACANLSSLLVARGRSREQHVALRVSLGASRARLMSTELVQSLIVCFVAAGVSLVLMLWAVGAIQALVPAYFRPFVLTSIDWRVAGFAVLATIVAAVMAGAVPAWCATRTGIVTVIQRGAGVPAHGRRSRAGGAMLAFEAAIGILLVASAAVAGRSFIGLATTDVGFQPDGLEILRVQPEGERRGGDDAAELAYYRAVLDVIRRQPDVAAAAGVDSMPAGGMAPMTGATWNGSERIGVWRMTDGFLPAIGARVVAGRDIARDDLDDRRSVALVSQAAARRLWPGTIDEDVIGRELSAPNEPLRTVIGVVADLRDRPDRPGEPRVFVPITPDADIWFVELVVRPRAGSAVDTERLRRQLESLGVTSVSARPAGGSIRTALEQPRVQAIIFSGFAVVGLVLAALGLFAVASFDVAMRRYEMGIRVALGASARRIGSLVVRDAVRPVAVGSIAGLVAAYWAAGFMQALVHDIDARDPGTLALVVAVLLATAALAAWIPARRAARTDPAEVLRTQ